MQDLNATMFYKAKFEITAKEDAGSDLLWKLIMNIRHWITHKMNHPNQPAIIESNLHSWSAFKIGGRFYDLTQSNRIYCESSFYQLDENDPATISWACQIVEHSVPKSGFAAREWITEIGYQAITTHSATISYVVTYSDMAGFIGLCEEVPVPNVPKVIRYLLSDKDIECIMGDTPLQLYPIKLNPGDYPDFENLLVSPHRMIPIIYISPKRTAYDSEDTSILVSPDKMAESVAANALVYYSESLDFTREMHCLGNSNYYCSNGYIRVYLPHVDMHSEQDHYRHRFLTADFIESHGEECIINIFRRAIAQDVHFYESLFRLEDCKELNENTIRQIRIDELKARTQGEIDEASEAYIEESERHKATKEKIRQCKDEIDKLKSDNYSLRTQVESLSVAAEQCAQTKAAVQHVREVSKLPNTPTEIAHYFETVFSDRIAFTERAYRSLKDCTTKPDFLWEVLYHIATDLYDLVHEKPATAYQEFTCRTRWDCSRGEGAQTHDNKKIMRTYVDYYNNQEIDIEPHVKNGTKESDPKFIRVHFSYDPNIADKIVIGHCGRHLENASSQKARR